MKWCNYLQMWCADVEDDDKDDVMCSGIICEECEECEDISMGRGSNVDSDDSFF